MLATKPLLIGLLVFSLTSPGSNAIAAQEGVPYCHSYAGLNFPDFMVMWDYDNPASTEKKFKALLQLASNSHDKTYLSELLSQIARTHVMRDDYQEAEFYLKQAQLFITDAEPSAEANYLREKARLLLDKDQQKAAVDSLKASWQIADENRYDLLAIETALELERLVPAEQPFWKLKAKLLAKSTKDLKAQQWVKHNQAQFL
ncbi:hypothetical protein MD588_13540 [Photobacterium sp. SDRW27]|uniref:hypothetical protein n=1 Tax=Photobacterium obscurum TaxID=2829490 RepID=UPI002244C55E|nr:hypothetical protein [Photobacterium obscurum]MCW8329831.1 hypothetical protein [Photobacterium obscurum]